MCTDDSSIDHLQRELSVEGINIQRPRLSLQSEML